MGTFGDFSFGLGGGTQSFFGDAGDSSFGRASLTPQPSDEIKKTRKSVAAKQPTEPGYVPVTISMINQAVLLGSVKPGQCEIHGHPCGVVKLVGYVLESNERGGATEFQMSDGSGAITVLAEASSDNESWFNSKLEVIKVGQLIRVVGTVHNSDDGEGASVRALHFCTPDPREYAYQHAIECSYVLLSLTDGGSTMTTVSSSQDVASKIADLSLSPKDAHGKIDLPSLFNDVSLPCERHALKYVLKHRAEDLGVKVDSLKQYLKNQFSASDVEAAISSLMDAGHVFTPIETYIDALTA